MGKKNAKNDLKKHDESFLFESNELYEDDVPDEMAIAEMMGGFLEAGNHHLSMAMELTRIAIGKTSENMKVEDVFATFKKAMNVISESTPLKDITEKLSQFNTA